MKISDFQIRNHDKLDAILVGLCDQVVAELKRDPTQAARVAAAVLDTKNRMVTGIAYEKNGKYVHGERDAINNYNKKYGPIPAGSIIVTTCSPCTEPMPDRVGSSCQDLISGTDVHKVYAGYRDPSQDTESGDKTYHLQITRNKKIQELCQRFADTWLKDKLNELSFLGSPCTKDCSGHRAGYEWSKARAGAKVPNSWSPSFNNGAALHKAGK